jgi:TRAP transporter 4TM/12TM fusion protein
MGVISTIVVAFLLFGAVLFATGAGKFLTDVSYAAFGRFSGGPAKGAVVASCAFGMISGSPVSDVLVTGSINIPLMIKAGYGAVFAGAVEAVASTGGGMCPPVMGSVAFIMAEFLDIRYADVCIAAAWPAILYFTSVFTQVHFRARKTGLMGRPVSELPPLKYTLLHGWHFFLPLLVLIFFLLIARYPAETSAFYAIAAALIVGVLRKQTRVGPRKMVMCLEQTATRLTIIVPVCTGAGLILGSVGLTGLGIHMSSILINLAGGNVLVLLILTAAVGAIMAMGVPWTGCYILLALLVAPTLISMGIVPKAAHLFLLYLGLIAFITPPICIAVHSARSLSKTDVWPTGLQAVRLGVVAYLVPFLFVFNPALIFEDSIWKILYWMPISLVVVFALAAGMEGFVIRKARWFQRTLLIVGAVLLGIPRWTTSIAGGAFIAGAVVLNAMIKKGSSYDEREVRETAAEAT